MFEVVPKRANRAFYRIFRMPEQGTLLKNGIPMQVGSLFTQQDINESRIKYQHTLPIPNGQTESVDSFDFTLWDRDLGTITSDSYSACMPPRSIETLSNGIFRFLINITKPVPFEVYVSLTTDAILELDTVTLTHNYISVQPLAVDPETIVHTITKPLVNGFVTLRGERATAFTQADVNANMVKYINTQLGNGREEINLTSCSLSSECHSNQLVLDIKARFKQTGDNVIYAQAGGVFSWAFSATGNALWRLYDGTVEAPKNAQLGALHMIEWSTYSTSSDYPDNSEERGPGYDKEPMFRNILEELYWNGGLPTGVAASNTGYIATTLRSPASLAGSQPWTLPMQPASYPFQMIATDPKTGQIDIRKYMLITTPNGYGSNGQVSESKDL